MRPGVTKNPPRREPGRVELVWVFSSELLPQLAGQDFQLGDLPNWFPRDVFIPDGRHDATVLRLCQGPFSIFSGRRSGHD